MKNRVLNKIANKTRSSNILPHPHYSAPYNSMTIKYKQREYKKCDMCCKYEHHHIYIDDKSIMKKLFPEIEWEIMEICEPCAQRECGSKNFNQIKRKI